MKVKLRNKNSNSVVSQDSPSIRMESSWDGMNTVTIKLRFTSPAKTADDTIISSVNQDEESLYSLDIWPDKTSGMEMDSV